MSPEAVVRAEGMSRVYSGPAGPVPALVEADLTFFGGELVAVVGPSGSGKSTLLNLLGCLDTPTAGRYYLDGVEVSAMGRSTLATMRCRTIGFVFQSYHLLAWLTAAENVALPLVYAGVGRKQRLERAREVLAAVGIGDRADHRPNELSGGQQQRTAIARALVNRPRLLLADEPTGNLDQKTGAEIMSIFGSLRQEGMTIVIVTHDEAIARQTDRVIRLVDGRVVRER